MANEVQQANELVAKLMGDPKADKDSAGRAIINAVIEQYKSYRSADDIASELQYLADNLDEDEFVITRGC